MFPPQTFAGKYLQWFPSRSGSLGSMSTAQVSWSRFVWHWSLAVLSFPFLSFAFHWVWGGKKCCKQLAPTRDAFVYGLPQRNDTAKLPVANVVQVSPDGPRGLWDLLLASPTEAEGG